MRTYRREAALVFQDDVTFLLGFLSEKHFTGRGRFAMIRTAAGHLRTFRTVTDGRRRIATAQLLERDDKQ